jgi:hypothetical protein
MHGEIRNAFKILVGKPEGKRPLRRPRHRWEDNINMDFWKIVFGLDSSGSGQGLMVGFCEHGNDPSDSIKGISLVAISI